MATLTNKLKITAYILLFCALPLTACGKAPVYSAPAAPGPAPQTSRPAVIKPTESRLSKLQQQHQQWHGVPYRYGGMTKKGIDCSGFVYLTFKEKFNATMPRTTRELAKKGNPISRRDLRPGDLILFKISGKGRHVGIYMDDGTFLHASTSKGVMTSHLNNPYWQKSYWQSRRVLTP